MHNIEPCTSKNHPNRPVQTPLAAITPQSSGLAAAEVERLDTFMPELAEQVCGHRHAEGNGSFRCDESRGLIIHPGGTFHDFTDDCAARGAVTLSGSQNDAVTFAKAFLASHPGTGSLTASVDPDEEAKIDEDDIRRTSEITEHYRLAGEIGSPGAAVVAACLKHRSIAVTPPLAQPLRVSKNTSTVSMLATLTEDDAGFFVAIQETLLARKRDRSRPHRAAVAHDTQASSWSGVVNARKSPAE